MEYLHEIHVDIVHHHVNQEAKRWYKDGVLNVAISPVCLSVSFFQIPYTKALLNILSHSSFCGSPFSILQEREATEIPNVRNDDEWESHGVEEYACEPHPLLSFWFILELWFLFFVNR